MAMIAMTPDDEDFFNVEILGFEIDSQILIEIRVVFFGV